MKILFAGTPEFAVSSLAALSQSPHELIGVYTQPDRHAGRGQHMHKNPVKLFAESQNLNIYQPETLRDPDAQKILRDLKPDILIVVAYGLLLPEAVLAIPKYGCINIHASLLPRWRGAAPIQRAILAGDTETGITIMQMDAGLDTGPMLAKTTCPILPEDTAEILHDRLAPLGAQLLMSVINNIEYYKTNFIIQDNSKATNAPKLTKAEAEINWHNSAANIQRAIHGYNPFPVAYSYCNNQLVRLWQCEIISQKTNITPGTILEANNHGIDIATDDGIVRMTKLQLAGGKILTAQEMLNARAQLFKPGNLFTNVT